jgi:hypothetical protein
VGLRKTLGDGLRATPTEELFITIIVSGFSK